MQLFLTSASDYVISDIVTKLPKAPSDYNVAFINTAAEVEEGDHWWIRAEKEGMLHPRNLINEKGWIYCSIYLDKENKEFFEKYPKVKKEQLKTIMLDSEGKEINR